MTRQHLIGGDFVHQTRSDGKGRAASRALSRSRRTQLSCRVETKDNLRKGIHLATRGEAGTAVAATGLRSMFVQREFGVTWSIRFLIVANFVHSL
jgi:hypothetical protein